MMLNGACYIRVSTDDQTEFSPDAQLKALKEYAKKNDITLSKEHIYADEGISGKRADKRPAFMQMIATAKLKPKPFDVILVHKFDRFARSREDSVVYKSLLKKEAGVKVVSITESIEDDKFSVILEAMLEAMAEYYSLNLAEEVKKGMLEKATRGGFQSTPSFGYKAEAGKLVIIPEEAEFIKFVFQKYADGEMGMFTLAQYANEVGIKTKRGSPFENRTVEYILNNPVYIGKLRWTPTGKVNRIYNHPDTIVADGEHQAIIALDLWNQVQDRLSQNKELYKKRQKSTAPIKSWLNGLIKCGVCGKTLVNSQSDYLQCNGYAKGICKKSQHVKTSRLEGIVLEELGKAFHDSIELEVVPKVSDTVKTNEHEFLQDRLNKLDVKEIRIKEAYLGGIDTLSEYKENKLKLETEREKLTQQLKMLKDTLIHGNEDGEIVKRIENVYTLLSDSTISTDIKYKTAHFLIDKIVFNKHENLLSIQYK